MEVALGLYGWVILQKEGHSGDDARVGCEAGALGSLEGPAFEAAPQVEREKLIHLFVNETPCQASAQDACFYV